MAKRKEAVVLYDTTEYRSYEDYKEWCEFNEREPQSEDSADYWNYVVQSSEWDLDDFFSNVQYSSVNNRAWIVTGSVGTWQGSREIYPKVFNSLLNALYGCSGQSINDMIVKKRGNVVEVEALHHDGTNRFELRALSDKGEDRYIRNDTVSVLNRENIEKLPEWLF